MSQRLGESLTWESTLRQRLTERYVGVDMRNSLPLGRMKTIFRTGSTAPDTVLNVISTKLSGNMHLSTNALVDIGKFMNGYTLANYMDPPKGFDHTDVLVSHYKDTSRNF